jgi:hypothetical protein
VDHEFHVQLKHATGGGMAPAGRVPVMPGAAAAWPVDKNGTVSMMSVVTASDQADRFLGTGSVDCTAAILR